MTDYLDEIQARADAATDGPWAAENEHCHMPGATPAWCVSHTLDGKWLGDVAWVGQQSQDEANAEFIAHARTDVPRLVAALRAVEALHTRVGSDDQTGFCAACCDMEPLWPCPTITAIRDALEAPVTGPQLVRHADAPTQPESEEPMGEPTGFVQMIREALMASDRCPRSKHVGGILHGWRFDGDDPYVHCDWCGEMRDLTGRVVRKAGS